MTSLLALLLAGAATSPAMVKVGPGVARPAFAATAAERSVPVAAYWLDVEPVTNAEFLAFVRVHPAWRRDRAPRLFVDEAYLAGWAGPTQLGLAAGPRAPVTQVSWFAARAYCAARAARLPTESEWELAAAADETRLDAGGDPAFLERIVAWYGRPTPERLPAVGASPANAWGVRDLHGLVWEWVLDFAGSTTGSAAELCGGAPTAGGSKLDYAGFMRAAFRSSLEARFTTRNLGFRCARELGGSSP